jgi:hypothetical protein
MIGGEDFRLDRYRRGRIFGLMATEIKCTCGAIWERTEDRDRDDFQWTCREPSKLGFQPRLASPIKNHWPAVLSRAATAVVSAHCGPSQWTIQAAARSRHTNAALGG